MQSSQHFQSQIHAGIPATAQSPIEQLTDQLRCLLASAHDNMQHLDRQLEPIRCVAPTKASTGESVPAASPLEGVLYELISAASRLNCRIGELRDELRI